MRDCIVASQLAAIYNRKDLIKEYLSKAFEWGCTLYMVQNIKVVSREKGYIPVKVLDPILKDSTFKKELEVLYEQKKQLFLNRIDFPLRSKIIARYCWDQGNKNIVNYKKGVDYHGHDTIYFRILVKNMLFLDSLIEIGKLPSERIIGIDRTYSEVEVGKGFKDLDYYYYYYNSLGRNVDRFGPFKYQNGFNTDLSYVMLLHATRLASVYQAYLYITPKIENLIKSGQMHPEEYGFLGDFSRDKIKEKAPKYYFYEYRNNKSINVNDTDYIQSNIFRERFYLPSIELDRAKQEYQDEHDVKLFFNLFDN
jgi:hypothetical protein